MSRVLVPASNQFGTATGVPVTDYPFTVGYWFNTSNLSPGSDQHHFTMAAADGNNNVITGLQNGGKIFGGVSNNLGTFDVVFDSANTTANAWHSVLWACANSTSRTLYVDGVSVATGTLSLSFTNTNTNTWFGSYEGGASDVVGQMAEIAVWNAALNVNEALAFHRGMRPTRIRPANLKMYAPLFGASSPEPDLSGNKRNFTLTGSPAKGASHAPMTLLTPWPGINPEIAAGGPPPSGFFARAYYDMMIGRANV